MIKIIAITAVLSCPKVEVKNVSKLPWTQEDEVSLEFNKNRCVIIQVY